MKFKTYCYEDWSDYVSTDNGENDLVVKNLLIKSKRIYQEAEFSYERGMYDLCADRLYFSLLNSCRALLTTSGKETGYIHVLFLRLYLYFIHTSILPQKDYDLLINLYNLREKADHKDFFITRKEDVESFLIPAKDLIERISMIANPGNKHCDLG